MFIFCVCRTSCLSPTTPSGRTQRCSSFGVPTSSLRPRHRCPRDTALAATPGTGQLQTGAYGIPSAERYGAIVPESTRSGIKPARPSPVTVVIHTTAARPAVPSVNSRPSLVSCCSLHLLEHSTQRHLVCTISFFISLAAKDIPVSSILP